MWYAVGLLRLQVATANNYNLPHFNNISITETPPQLLQRSAAPPKFN